MTACSSCGHELPEGALYCTDCGARAADYSVVPPGASPSHFNSGITVTSSAEGEVFAAPAEQRHPSRSRRGLVVAAIAIVLVLLAGVTVESGLVGLGGAGGGASGPAVNSPGNPFTGEQLYSAYQANTTQAAASYSNKTVYIQDSLDFGAAVDLNTGMYYSSVDSGAVVLYWSSQVQVGQLYPGATVLARCSVDGVQRSAAFGYVLYLQDCDLLKVQSQGGSPTVSVSQAND